MPNQQAPQRDVPRPAGGSGIGITAVRAAALCRKEERRDDRLTQSQVDRILPYQDKDCCTD